jgi:hypothetical protein
MDRKNETYSQWDAYDLVFDVVEKARGGSVSRALSWLFLVWAILAFFYAEIDWLTAKPSNGGIGVGASAYVLVLYARPITLAGISIAFAILGRRMAIPDALRLSRRDVFGAPKK